MKLSHEKIVKLSHMVMDAIEHLDEIEIFEEPNTIRQEVVKRLNDLMKEEEAVDRAVKLQITSQRRNIPEGGAEWEILYRKYYNDALRKLGVVFSASART